MLLAFFLMLFGIGGMILLHYWRKREEARRQETDNLIYKARLSATYKTKKSKKVCLLDERLYELDFDDYESCKNFWLTLSGKEFELELAKVFKRKGYEVELTPNIGDNGVDIFLRKDGYKTVVQCKAHFKPVGSREVRELYGAMYHFDACYAILASTGGFTRTAFDFVQNKRMRLFTLPEIIAYAQSDKAEFTDMY